MSLLKNKIVWLVGVPFVMAAIVWGPYWVWNLLHAQSAWWRIPIISGTVFDTSAYLQWLGQTANGFEIGGHIRWFVWPLRLITKTFPNWSVSEWWLLTRWISMVAVIWVMAWSMRAWSGIDIVRSRIMAIVFWVSWVFALGLRPGVFSWYLPIGIFCSTAPLYVIRGLRERKFFSAILWTISALALSTVYTWFMIAAVVWLATIWCDWLISRSVKLFLAALVFVIAATIFATPTIAAWLSFSESGMLLLDMQLKSGLGFTRLPQITNSFFALLAWIGIFFAVRAERFERIRWAWFALLLTWLITPFTGVYLHNDHFRVSVIILSWLSLTVLWSVVEKEKILLTPNSSRILSAIFAFSIAVILNILRKPYAFNNDDLQILHLSHWFTVALSCWLLLSRRNIASSAMWLRTIVIGAIFIGVIGATSIYRREFTELPNRMRQVEAIEWIRNNIPTSTSVCSDPGQADFLATFTGLRIFPAGTTLCYREPSVDALRRMGVYSSGYDVRGSGNLEYVTYINHFGRSMICHQFPLHYKILKLFGIFDEHIDAISGCPRTLLDQLNSYTMTTVRQSEVDALAFKAVCQIVLISSDQKLFWHLPKGYQETRINDQISAWRAE